MSAPGVTFSAPTAIVALVPHPRPAHRVLTFSHPWRRDLAGERKQHCRVRSPKIVKFRPAPPGGR